MERNERPMRIATQTVPRPVAVLLAFGGALLLASVALLLLTERPSLGEGAEASAASVILPFVVAMVLATTHVAGPHLRRFFASHEGIVRSLGGGMAAAYAFLLLLPELEYGHEFLGDGIHFLMVGGLLFFLALEIYLQRSEERGELSVARAFHLHIAMMWLYNWTVVYALPDLVLNVGAQAMISAAAIGLHLLYKDFVVGFDEQEEFDRWGRFCLASAPLVGWACAAFFTPTEAVGDLLIALLAGYLLQNVFRNELPGYRESKIRWFTGGVLLFALPVGIYFFVL
jgi:hypothetical protein